MSGGAPGSGAIFGHVPGQGTGAGLVEGPAGVTGPIEGPAEVGEVAIAIPGLLLADVSWSVDRVLETMGAGLDDLARGLRQHAVASQSAFLGISTFADDARTELGLTRIADPSVAIPELRARGNGTNFHAAFINALSVFRADLPMLATTSDGGRRQIFRPTIYMFTDGRHNTGGDWRVPRRELDTRDWSPNFMVFGWGDADRAVISEIASEGMAYYAEDGQTPDRVLDQVLKVILRSMISATVSAAAQAANPAAPTTAPVIDPKTDPATAGLAMINNGPIGGSFN